MKFQEIKYWSTKQHLANTVSTKTMFWLLENSAGRAWVNNSELRIRTFFSLKYWLFLTDSTIFDWILLRNFEILQNANHSFLIKQIFLNLKKNNFKWIEIFLLCVKIRKLIQIFLSWKSTYARVDYGSAALIHVINTLLLQTPHIHWAYSHVIHIISNLIVLRSFRDALLQVGMFINWAVLTTGRSINLTKHGILCISTSVADPVDIGSDPIFF